MNLKIKDVHLETEIARAPEKPGPEDVRKEARIDLSDYDETHYIVGLKRGSVYVRKFLLEKEGRTEDEARKTVSDHILAGDFDEDLTEGYRKLKDRPLKAGGREL